MYDKHTPEGDFLAGDADAIADVYQWIARVLTRARFWSLRPDLPDLHQEVVVRVTAGLQAGRFERGRDFKGYVIGVAQFTAMKTLDKNRVRAGYSGRTDEAHADWHGGQRGDFAQIEARQLARVLLEESGDTCRELILLYFFEDRSYDEIARDKDLAIGTIKSRLHRCLEKLKKFMHDRNESPRGDNYEERPVR